MTRPIIGIPFFSGANLELTISYLKNRFVYLIPGTQSHDIYIKIIEFSFGIVMFIILFSGRTYIYIHTRKNRKYLTGVLTFNNLITKNSKLYILVGS